MRLSFLAYLLPSIFGATVVFAQDSIPRIGVGIHVGVNNLMMKDQFHSPYTYKGNNFNFGFTFSKIKLKTQQFAELNYTVGSIQSAVSPGGRNQLVNLKYDYLFSLGHSQQRRLRVSVGPGLSALYNSANYLPDVDMPGNIISIGAYLSLSANVNYNITEKLSVKISLSAPLIGYVYRPDFEAYGKTYSGLSFPGRGGMLSTAIELNYRLTSKVDIFAQYRYNYFTYSQPRTLAILQDGLSFGVRIKF